MKKLLAALTLVFVFSLLLASVAFAVPPHSRTKDILPLYYYDKNHYDGLLPRNRVPNPSISVPKVDVGVGDWVPVPVPIYP